MALRMRKTRPRGHWKDNTYQLTPSQTPYLGFFNDRWTRRNHFGAVVKRSSYYIEVSGSDSIIEGELTHVHYEECGSSDK